MPPHTASPRHIHIHLASPCPHLQACTHPAPCFHLPDPLHLGPRSLLAHRVHLHPPRVHRKEWFPITPIPLHPHTRPHRRERALPCKRRPNNRHITSTTHLPDIRLIGRRIIRGLAIHLQRR